MSLSTFVKEFCCKFTNLPLLLVSGGISPICSWLGSWNYFIHKPLQFGGLTLRALLHGITSSRRLHSVSSIYCPTPTPIYSINRSLQTAYLLLLTWYYLHLIVHIFKGILLQVQKSPFAVGFRWYFPNL